METLWAAKCKQTTNNKTTTTQLKLELGDWGGQSPLEYDSSHSNHMTRYSGSIFYKTGKGSVVLTPIREKRLASNATVH